MHSPAPRSSSGSSRQKLRRLLETLISGGRRTDEVRRGRLLLERLENRQLLAGDVDLWFTDGDATEPSPGADAAEASGEMMTMSTAQAEGEAAPDLVQFAKDLADADVKMYGAHWCPACTEQKQLFEDGGDYLPFINVSAPDRTLNDTGVEEGIESFPTWEFPDGSREEGLLDLETISERSGVAIPQGESPTFREVGSQTVQIGSPLHIPIDAYDPDGGPLTVTVSVADPSLLEATVISGNRSLRLDMEGYGDMVFELFEQRAERPTGRVAELAENDFYDGIIFHRVIDGFMIQGGDPTGTGTSGSSLGEFDDQFHPDLQHNRSGVLSFAKTQDDTNNSQFFITEEPTRHLDFNHSIFGQLVEGDAVREAISNVEVDDSDKPTTDVTIAEASIFDDTENSVIMLKALGGTGETDVTITVTDADGNTHSETVSVDVVADSANSQPFLEEIEPPAPSDPDTPVELQLSSIDVEGDDVRYLVDVPVGEDEEPNATATVDEDTGLVTVTPAAGFSGAVDVLVGVQAASGGGNNFDSQLVTFSFEGEALAAPTGLELHASSDTGASDEDNITSDSSLTFVVEGTIDGATVEIVDTETDDVVGSTTASGDTATVTTTNIAALGDGTYTLAARQRTGDQASGLSSTLTLQYDNTRPASVASSAATQANVGREFTTDLISPEEGSGLEYAFGTAPSGATIDSTTGVISWTPSADQSGSHTFVVELTDLAGNVRSDSFTVEVNDEPLAEIRLELTDLDGNPLSSVDVGDEFLLRFYGVDARTGDEQAGLFAAHADILFNDSLVQPKPGSTIEYSNFFTTTQSGSFADGLIDELGAASSQTSPSNQAESLIATVTMEALESGNVNFRSEPADESGSETLLYLIDDEISSTEIAYGSTSLAIGLNFSLVDDDVTVEEDSGPTTIDVLDNDQTDSSSDELSVVSVTQPASGGSVTLSDGVVRFTPDDDFVGTTEFTYRAGDDGGGQQTATVTVTVTGVNDPPVGSPDQFVVDEDSSDNTLDVLENDSAGPGEDDDLTITGVSESAEEAGVSVSDDGESIVYTPPAGFTGTDSFTYTLSDGELTTEVEVSVLVAPADAPPTANPDSFEVIEDDSEAEFDVLANDTADEDGQDFVLSDVGEPSAGGSVRISEDGTRFFYEPAADFNGTEEVTYTLRDTGGGLAVGTVTFTVEAVNDPPPASSPTVRVNRNDGERSVLALDDLPENVDGNETLEFTDLSDPAEGGSVRIDGDAILYTPPSDDFTGEDSFTYTVEDPEGETSTGTITVEVYDYETRRIDLVFDGELHSAGLSSAAIRLTGTNALGDSVDMPVEMNGNGGVFANLLPGNYTVEIPAIPFLQNAAEPQQIEVESAPDDGDMEVNASLGRLRPEFLSIRDWLGSTPRHSVLTAIAPGEAALLTQPSSDTGEISDPVIEFGGDGSEVTIRGTNGDGDEVQATLPADGDYRVQTRGRAGDLRLMRVDINSDSVEFEEASEASTSAANTGAEGETLSASSAAPSTASIVAAADDAEPQTEQGSSRLTLGDSQAEGESTAAVTSADLFVPDPAQVNARSRATVMPLASGQVEAGVQADNAHALDDSTTGRRSAKATGTESVDAAMSLVSPQLMLQSTTADTVAQQRLSDRPFDAAAIDAVLGSDLDS